MKAVGRIHGRIGPGARLAIAGLRAGTVGTPRNLHPAAQAGSAGEPWRWPTWQAQPRKKLYIETVGCQMNVLDSELVVARAAQRGLRADRRHRSRPTRSSTTPARSASTPRTRSIARWAGSSTSSSASPSLTIGVLGCMAQKDQGQILKRAPHVDIVVGPGQLGRVPELLDRAREENTPQMAVSLARAPPAHATRSPRASRGTTRSASRPCGPARSRRSSGS